jgi:hypothetical protein
MLMYHQRKINLKKIKQTCNLKLLQKEGLRLDVCSPRNENLNLLIRIKFLIFFYIVLNKNRKNLLVRTKPYWSWDVGPVLIMRTVFDKMYFDVKNVFDLLSSFDADLH